MDDSTPVQVTLEVVSAVELLTCLAVAAVLLVRWRRHRSAATGAALGMFAVLALVLVAAYAEPASTSGTAGAVYTDVLICVLLALPYLLVRFTWALGAVGDRAHRMAVVLLALVWSATLVTPTLPEEGEPTPRWAGVYIAGVLAVWTVQSAVAALGLWRSGRGQSSVVRHRMRSLSAGAVLLAATLVLSGSAGDDQPGWVEVGVSLLGMVSILLFALAFLLPPSLRLVWRQADLAALSSAERGLMAALSRDDVAATIVPVLGSVFGGGDAALLDERAVPVRTTAVSDDETAALTRLLADRPADGPPVQEVGPGVLAVRLSLGWVVVRAGRLAPVFGDDEAVLLGRVGTLVDLALQRVHLFEQERASREAAEAATAELETLLYSVSHDLRSPLISVLGYLDVLQQEHVAQLTGDGPHYLDRISVNAVYMQSLISDLLELSRIGRSDPPSQRLDLQALAEQVVEGAQLSHPRATVQVAGPLPVVRMSDVRARQLVTNLVDNALKHGGREDLAVTVACSTGSGGELVLDVADDGRGIPPEYRTRVLRVFERLDAPKTSPGTGMGLAICKRIAESLGGTLAVEGPPPGAATGTTVRVTLPATVVVAGVPAPRRAGADAPAETSTKEML